MNTNLVWICIIAINVISVSLILKVNGIEDKVKNLDEKHLLCLKTYEFKSKHNLVLKCDEVNTNEH